MPDGVIEHAGTETHPITVEPAPSDVLLRVGDQVLARTDAALILREASYGPVYYLPKTALRDGAVQRVEKSTHCPFKGDATYWTVTLPDGRSIDAAAWSYETPIDGIGSIQGHLGFYTQALDAEFEPPAR